MLPQPTERSGRGRNLFSLLANFADMNFMDFIAERRIIAAIDRGELSGLPGQGAPLNLDDEALIPETLRMAYRILRNAGFVPPEVQTLRAIGDLERSIEDLPEGEPRSHALRKLQLLRFRLETSGRQQNILRAGSRYAQKLLIRFEEQHSDDERLADNGLDEFGLGEYRSNENGLDENGLEQNGLEQNGLDQNGLDRNGVGQTCLDEFHVDQCDNSG
jgi:hypothetical protein